jgi:PIN domain nuclease of toxin-antitoxin system
MKLLLDTHILLWWLDDDKKLSENGRQFIRNPDNDIFVSHISLLEIQIKAMKGTLNANLETIEPLAKLPTGKRGKLHMTFR